MKKLFTTAKNLILGAAVLMSSISEAQFTSFTPTGSYTFTQDVSYQAGRTPNFNVDDAQDAYEDWKSNFITSSGACGERRVIWDYFSGGRGKTDKSSTVSEGVAYGMLLAAYAGDKSLFDDLWAYYKQHRNGNGVMNWQIENCNTKGYNGASDAELDVAMALVVASHQWQSDSYLNDAKNMIRIVREHEFDGSVLKPGDAFGGNSLTNPSYFSPAYYRVFAQLEPNYSTFWNNAVTKGYQIIEAAGGSNGIVPDWCNGSGQKVNGQNIDGINVNSTYEDGGQNFVYDGIRTPFRSAVDYLWHGDDAIAGKEYCAKIIDWAYDNHGGTTWQMGSKYATNGSKLNNDHSNTFVGCFGIAAMAAEGGTKSNTQYASFLQSAYDDNKQTQPGYGQYFNSTFKVLSFFVMSGHFYLPPPDACDAPDLGADISLCQSNTTLSSNISAAQYTWKKDGAIVGTSSSINAATYGAGSYDLITTQSDGCARRDNIEVFEGTIAADFIYQKQGADVEFTSTSTGGISDYTWKKAAATVGANEATLSQTLATGTYEYTLSVSNAGFGCSGTDEITKTVIIGEGKGWAAHDFNDYSVAEPFVASDNVGGTWVAIDAYAPGLPTKADGSSDNPCSLLEIECAGGGTGDQYKPFGINLREETPGCNTPTAGNNYCSQYAAVDISAAKFISFKIKSTAAAKIRVDLGAADGTKGDGPTVDVAGTNEWEVHTIDFSSFGGAWGQTGDISWDQINAIQFFPFVSKTTFAGTLVIDWIVIGDKQMPTPFFALETDQAGDYIYVPDVDHELYDPNDDPENWPYTEKTVWEREVLACTGTAEVDASSCWADEIRIYQGNKLEATGAINTLEPGDYRVELINAGGITEDYVTVSSANVAADFTVDRENLSVKFNNNSSDYDTFVWSYGDAANDAPGSETWDIGYHNYETAGAGTYSVKLTVTNTECGTSKAITKQVTVACDMPTTYDYVLSDSTDLCEGDVITIEILNPLHAVWFGFYAPLDAETVYAADSLSATITMGKDEGDLTIKTGNGCSADIEKAIALENSYAPIADFTVVEDFANKVDFAATATTTDSYDWTFGDATSDAGATVSHTFASTSIYNVCLDVSGRCGADQLCKDVSASITGLSNFDAAGNVNVFPTAVASELNVILPGAATISVTDVLGNTLSETNITDQGSINVSDLNAGMYMLSIEQNGEVVTKRFVKQ